MSDDEQLTVTMIVVTLLIILIVAIGFRKFLRWRQNELKREVTEVDIAEARAKDEEERLKWGKRETRDL